MLICAKSTKNTMNYFSVGPRKNPYKCPTLKASDGGFPVMLGPRLLGQERMLQATWAASGYLNINNIR